MFKSTIDVSDYEYGVVEWILRMSLACWLHLRETKSEQENGENHTYDEEMMKLHIKVAQMICRRVRGSVVSTYLREYLETLESNLETRQ